MPVLQKRNNVARLNDAATRRRREFTTNAVIDEGDTRMTKGELKRFNEKRRDKRNSKGFALDADCSPRPDSGAAAKARWNPTPRQKLQQSRRTKKHEHARKWC
mgnify:CR=1 FL=1